MNMYEKMAIAKKEFHNLKLKKSGVNKFAGYHYFELSDFIQPIIQILANQKLVTFVDFGDTVASLTVIDVEKPEDRYMISCPMSVATMKGCQPVQNLGAVMTYTRRYLFVNLFDIIENDAIDSAKPANKQKTDCPPDLKPSPLAFKKAELLTKICKDFKLIPPEEQSKLQQAASKSIKAMTYPELQAFDVGLTEIIEIVNNRNAKKAADEMFKMEKNENNK